MDQVRAANSRFKDVNVAVAEGYASIPCASGVDAKWMPRRATVRISFCSSPLGAAMGVHYVNAGYLKDEVPDIKRRQAVMYEPLPNGKMELVAVEYISSMGPSSLEGQLFDFTSSPTRNGLGPFFELHLRAWKANQHGAFADMNPDVTCERAHEHALLLRRPTRPLRTGPLSDACAGFLGGLSGGLAAFPGAFVTIWCSFKDWDKARQRGVYQPFILAMQPITLGAIYFMRPSASLVVQLDWKTLAFVPAALLGAWFGLRIFRQLSDRQFGFAVNLLLVLSGIGLLL